MQILGPTPELLNRKLWGGTQQSLTILQGIVMHTQVSESLTEALVFLTQTLTQTFLTGVVNMDIKD